MTKAEKKKKKKKNAKSVREWPASGPSYMSLLVSKEMGACCPFFRLLYYKLQGTHKYMTQHKVMSATRGYLHLHKTWKGGEDEQEEEE